VDETTPVGGINAKNTYKSCNLRWSHICDETHIWRFTTRQSCMISWANKAASLPCYTRNCCEYPSQQECSLFAILFCTADILIAMMQAVVSQAMDAIITIRLDPATISTGSSQPISMLSEEHPLRVYLAHFSQRFIWTIQTSLPVKHKSLWSACKRWMERLVGSSVISSMH